MYSKILAKQLEKFGFTEAQAKLYLAGLVLKQALMMQLANTAGIKRTTAYYIMEELERRGFFAHRKIGKRIYYLAAKPKMLLKMTKEREQLIRKLMPKLNLLGSKHPFDLI